jgi:hypothetical protein
MTAYVRPPVHRGFPRYGFSHNNTPGPAVGARQLRRLSHDSLAALVNLSVAAPHDHIKLVYLCLCKIKELFRDGEGVISLEVKQRLKQAVCAGKVSLAPGTTRLHNYTLTP